MNIRDFFYRNQKIVVFDTEYTTWEGAMERDWSGDYEYREIVQIAAQKIDLQHEVVIDSYEKKVLPRINPILSEYFQSLTGISQEEVDKYGVDFLEMYKSFVDWAGDCTKYAYNKNEKKQADFVVIKENIDLYELEFEIDENEYGNLASVYQGIGVDTHNYNSGSLYKAFGLTLEGQEHNAMHDVNSLVQSLFATKRIMLGSATV